MAPHYGEYGEDERSEGPRLKGSIAVRAGSVLKTVLQLVDGEQELLEVRGDADDFDALGRVEQGGRPFTHEVVILGEDHANHGRMVHAPTEGRTGTR